MASNALIAFICAMGAGFWIYAKSYRTSGGTAKSAAIAAAVCGGLMFLLVFSVLGAIF